MTVSFRHLGWSALALFALVGCETAPTPPPATPSTTTPPAASEKDVIKSMPTEPAKPETKGASTAEPKLSDEEIAEIKKLPADEQPIAMAQMTCPVSDDKLGSMDKPIKQVVDGKTFFLCCTGCVDKVKSDPTAVLAKLKK